MTDYLLNEINTPLLAWYDKGHRDLPWRRDRDAYRIWVSEIMLQQTRVEAVKPYYFRFMERFFDVSELAGAKEELLLKYWEGLGYYSRIRNMKKAAQIIVNQYNGILPDNWDELDIFERRNFLNGTGVADIGKQGTVQRKLVCNLEIWCECFGKDPSALKKVDSYELGSIMQKLESWEKYTGTRQGTSNFTHYGKQRAYSRK